MFGIFLFWLSWPIQWLVMPLTRRVRVVIVQDQKILVVKNRIGPGQWTLPGGGVKFGETIEAAAAREIKEELSLDGMNAAALHEGLVIRKQHGLLFRFQYIQLEVTSDASISTNWEIAETSWKPPHEIEESAIPKSVALAATGLGTSTSDTL